MIPRIITRQEREARGGLGTVLQRVIHAGVDISPLPQKTKRAIKNCIPCGKRAKGIDRAASAIRTWTLRQLNKD